MQENTKSIKSLNRYILLAMPGFLGGLLAFSYMGTFMRIIGDDYFYAAVQKVHGFWNGQVHAYMNPMLFHGDRYTLNFLSMVFSLFPPKINAIIPTFVIIVFVTTLCVFFHSLTSRLKIIISKLLILLLSLVTAFFTFWLAPTVTQGLYWRSSMLPSFGPIIGTFLLAAYILWDKPLKWYSYLFTFLFSIINAGLSENGAVYQATMAGLVLFISLVVCRGKPKTRSRLTFLSIVSLTGSIGGLIIMWLSPSIARYHQEMSTSILSTLLLSVRHAYNHYKEMILSRYLYLAILVLVGGFIGLIQLFKNASSKTYQTWRPLKWLLSLLSIQIITFIFIVSLCFPSAYTRNAYPDPRHFMGSIVLVVIAVISSGYIIAMMLMTLPKMQGKHQFKGDTLLLFFSLIIIIIYPITTIPQITSNRYLYQYWSTQWDNRHQHILQAVGDGQDEIHVVVLDHIIEGVAELGPNHSNPWYNLPASQYYGIDIYADLPGWDEGFTSFMQSR